MERGENFKETGELEWVKIPAGEFWMGSEKGNDDEKPVHRLHLDTFWIARTPVTNSQYGLFVLAAGHRPPDHWQNGAIPAGLEQHPVIYVTWYDAIAYCHWLSEVTGKLVTLPSEVQWEKAARGDEDKREYPWGDSFDPKRANSEEAGIGQTSPVGSFPGGASPYGLLDMSGNVWEWTRTIWDKKFGYPYVAEDGREKLDIRAWRVARGGCFYYPQVTVRCTIRLGGNPNHGSYYIGFRVAVSLSAPLP
jgi:toxoflavin biosynthesis protein ToxD